MNRSELESQAAALFDGGWRKCDRDNLMQEYELTKDEADDICELLEEYENEERSKGNREISLNNGVSFMDAHEAIAQLTDECRLDAIWESIAALMDDDTREQVNTELAPCTREEFLTRYLEIAPWDLIIG